jgi:hypothetical protein
MKEVQMYFNVFPRVVPAGQKTTITVQPIFDHRKIKKRARYRVIHSPMETRGYDRETLEIVPRDGSFVFELLFEGEQEHILEIVEVYDEQEINYLTFSVYSLEQDLYFRKPYKGDMHMHSYYSDGRESPAYVAAACRRIGLDFMAITDHGQYFPSEEAQNAYEGMELDLKIFRGEEVHPPQNAVHMINFGGNFSVNELFKEEKYFREVEKIKNNMDGDLPEHDKHQYASCVWCFNKIREGGGMSIYCHPYWEYGQQYNVSTVLNQYIFKKQPFDAYEILGGYYVDQADSNTLQVACYNEQRSKGRNIPIVGVSDAHGCETGQLFGWYYTIVFSPELELSCLIDSIKELYSVAVESVPGEVTRIYGPARLVKYALFLVREVFPLHDTWCFEEGQLMMQYIAGDGKAAEKLADLKGRTAKLWEKYWK